MNTLCAALLIALVDVQAVDARATDIQQQAQSPGELDGRVTRLQAYKNGVALVSVRLDGTADEDGRLTYPLPPVALVLGSV